MKIICSALFSLAVLLTASQGIAAEPSRCFAMANALPQVQFVALAPQKLTTDQVRIRFIGHSTFVIETADGIRVATDFTGYAGPDVIPDVVTMNNAHESHFTDFVDPKIKHVLRGWNPAGGPVQHDLRLSDIQIRNVPTDRRGLGGGVKRDGNSIFVFEVANMCIAHVGHLHHELSAQYRALLGSIDVLMVPVDGTFTLSHTGMAEVIRLLRARLVLPMHYFGGASLAQFIDAMRGEMTVRLHDSPEIIVSQSTLPKTPTMLVLPGGH